MKQLIHIPIKAWIIILIMFITSLFFIVFLLNFRIEESFNTRVTSGMGHSSIFVKSDVVYKIMEGNTVHLHINGRTYSATIAQGGISKVLNKDLYKIDLVNLNFPLLPHSSIDATIITGSNLVRSLLFAGV